MVLVQRLTENINDVGTCFKRAQFHKKKYIQNKFISCDVYLYCISHLHLTYDGQLSGKIISSF